jgi:hypothetical protein
MFTHDMFNAVSGDYVGELNLDREIEVGHGIVCEDGRVFRVLSISTAGPATNRLRRLEVVESSEIDCDAHLHHGEK